MPVCGDEAEEARGDRRVASKVGARNPDRVGQQGRQGDHIPRAAAAEIVDDKLAEEAAYGVGMAITERHLAARFNRPGHAIVEESTPGGATKSLRPPRVGADRWPSGSTNEDYLKAALFTP